MKCQNCKTWEIKEGDNYCSLCEFKFFSLIVSISPSRFQHDDLPPPAVLLIENRSGQNEVRLDRITADQPWISLDLGGLVFPLDLKPLQKKSVEVTVETLDAEEEYATATIEVSSTAGSEKVTVEVLPPARMDIDTREYEILLDELNLEDTFAAIRMDSGAATIRRIIAEPEEWVKVELSEGLVLPLVMDARAQSQVQLRLIIDETRLRRLSANFPAIHDGTLRVVCDEFERTEPFRVKCWKPPELSIWEVGHQLDVLHGRRNRIALTLQNKDARDPTGGKGNATLLISSIQWKNSDGSCIEWIKTVAELAYPIKIEGSAFYRIEFNVDLTQAEAPAPARYALHFVAQTNSVRGPEHFRCDIRIARAAVYDGVLAIDFGTSNTCCAMLHRQENDYEMVALDIHNSAKPTTAPTVSYYLSAGDDGFRKLHIGAYADSLPAEPRVVQCTVRSPKRYLGKTKEEHPFEVRFAQSQDYTVLSPQEVVSDFLLQVKHAAEEKGRATFNHCIITHPARFRSRQLDDLRKSVHLAFGAECEVTTLQEPVASALDYIVTKAATERQSYILGVFDFGGGTTDLSLLSVSNTRYENVLRIDVRVVACTGKWFGGENLTHFIVEHALEKVKKALLSNVEVAKPAELLCDEHALTDRGMIALAKTTRLRVWQWSEYIKPLLFEKGDSLRFEEAHRNLAFEALTPVGPTTISISCDQLIPNIEELTDYLDRELRLLSGMLRGLLQRNGLNDMDCLLMSGKSSAIPNVARVLREEFPSSDVILSAEPKECVVRGACIFAKVDSAGDISINISGAQTTISNIGLAGHEEGQMVFKRWFPAGIPIPDAGLIETKRYIFSRLPVVIFDNDSDEDWLSRMNVRNPNIEIQGIYELIDPPDWLTRSANKLGKLEIRISPDYEVTLTGYVDGYTEALHYRQNATDPAAMATKTLV